MTIHFNIPADRKDLLDANNEYCLSERYNIAELSNDYRSLVAPFEQSEIRDYVENFLGVYYYVTEHIEALEWKLVGYYFENMKKVWLQLLTELDIHFNQKLQERVDVLNHTKIILFIVNEFIYACDKKINENSVGKSKKKSKKQAITVADKYYEKWCDMKKQVLFFMYTISNKSLPMLFDPPLPEEQFTDLISDPCYSSLKDNAFLKQTGIRETVFQIIGNLIKNYNHSNSFIIKFVHVVKNTEPNQQTPIAQGVIQLKLEYELNSVVNNISKDVLSMVEREKSSEAVELKNLLNFLTEISPHLPQDMIPVTSMLESLENYEFPSIRMCFCSVISDILLKVLNKEELSVEDQDLQHSYLTDLYDMTHDVSALIRSKVLQIMTKLLKDSSVPISWQIKLMQRAVGRLEDRAIMVRKNAILLLKEFMLHKPVDTPLDTKHLQENLNEASRKLDELHMESYKERAINFELWTEKRGNFVKFLMEAFLTEASLEIYESMEYEEEFIYDDVVSHIIKAFSEDKFDYVLHYAFVIEHNMQGATEERKKIPLQKQPEYFFFIINKLICKPVDKADSQVLASSEAALNQELQKKIQEQKKIIACLQQSVNYSEVISSAIPLIKQMLYSKAVNDTNEAIEFFASAVHLGIDSAYDGILDLLFLLVTQKENKDLVYKTLTQICLSSDPNGSERMQAVQSLRKLCFIMEKMSLGHRDPLSLLIKHWLEKKLITSVLIQVCWERVTRKLEDTTDLEEINCLVILSLVARHKPSVIWTNLNIVETVLLADFSMNNIVTAFHVFEMLKCMWMSSNPISNTNNVMATRLPKDNPIFEKITSVILHFYENPVTNNFRELCRNGLAVLYAGSDTPNRTVEKLISNMLPVDGLTSLKAWKLSRLLYTTSVAALQHLAYLDVAVYSELKHRKERKRIARNCETPLHNYSHRSHLESASKNLKNAADQSRASRNGGKEIDEDTEQKLWAGTEDLEANFVYDLCEKELLEEPTAFSYIYSFINEVFKRRNEYDDRDVQLDATAALISFMLISSKVCKKNMQALMSMLRFTNYPDVKRNIIVGIADLLGRFPNEVTPWESYLFEMLNDADKDVRKVALKFGCQLILTNSIRAKSHISDVALFLVEPDTTLKNLAIHFFKEISSKQLQLYNALPDIISKLTNPTLNVEETKFQIIMRIILSYIHKERHMDGLIVKLCLRMQVCTNNKQLRNLAFCLSLLNYNEKSIQELINNFQCFKEKLNIPEILKVFKDIVNFGNKPTAKPELKALCSELDNKIEALFEINDDQNHEPLPPRKGNPKSRRQRLRRHSSSSSEDEETAKSTSNNSVRRSSRSVVTKENTNKQHASSSSSSDDDRTTKKNRRK